MELRRSELHPGYSYNPVTGEFFREVRKGQCGLVGIIYNTNSDGYIKYFHNKKQFSVARVAYEIYTNCKIPSELIIDHINGIRNDNRIENLRLVTQGENCRNREYHRQGKLPGVGKGVFRSGRYYPKVAMNGQVVCLGGYDTAEEASAAYIAAVNNPDLKKPEKREFYGITKAKGCENKYRSNAKGIYLGTFNTEFDAYTMRSIVLSNFDRLPNL